MIQDGRSHGDNRHRHRSRTILEGRDRAPARSYLKGMGYTDEDLSKPIVGVAHSWIETMPCNYNHRHLAEKVKEGVREAGGTPMELNTVSISDGITMGTQGMKTSLVSREMIADSIELVGRGHMFDAMVTIVGCDKTIPGRRDGPREARRPRRHRLLRLHRPGPLQGPRRDDPGRLRGRRRQRGRQDVRRGSPRSGGARLPGAGACGGQYTANTMAMVLEFLGLSPMGSAGPTSPRRPQGRGLRQRRQAGHGAAGARPHAGAHPDPRGVRERHRRRGGHAAARPTSCCTCSPSPARSGFRSTSTTSTRQQPHPHHRRPQARRPLHRRRPRPRGGSRLFGKRLLDAGLIDGTQLTVTGRTLAEEVENAEETPGQDVIVAVEEPLRPRAGS